VKDWRCLRALSLAARPSRRCATPATCWRAGSKRAVGGAAGVYRYASTRPVVDEAVSAADQADRSEGYDKRCQHARSCRVFRDRINRPGRPIALWRRTAFPATCQAISFSGLCQPTLVEPANPSHSHSMRRPLIALMPHVVPVGQTVPRLDSVCKSEQPPVRANPYAHICTLQFWLKLWLRTYARTRRVKKHVSSCRSPRCHRTP
jgi:hypothetical protein